MNSINNQNEINLDDKTISISLVICARLSLFNSSCDKITALKIIKVHFISSLLHRGKSLTNIKV
jgi:hypothetical protein